MKFLPIKEFEKRQKSIDQDTQLALMASMMTIDSNVDAQLKKKREAKELKEKGNAAVKKKKYAEAEKIYSEAIELHPGCRPLYTNRAIVRNIMKKYDEALSDCESGKF